MTEIEESNFGSGLEIAVIGIAGRFPGAKNIEEFWENLKNGVETIAFFSAEELKDAGVEPGLLSDPSYVKAYGYLEDSEYFDPLFFGYNLREAETMDPQFRVLHECSSEALEVAGYVPGLYKGIIGLYVGSALNHKWIARVLSASGSSSEQFERGTFYNRNFLGTRISYKLNLCGPSFTVQTACSTSLVAIHLACQGLIGGECNIALAGGVSMVCLEKTGYIYQEGMICSKDGHCRAFDESAQGTVFGDGIGIVVLKPLGDAILAGDNIFAVIKGSAINNDGNRKVNYTAPSTLGEAAAIRAAHRTAEISPESISYVETHGTGTGLGDFIEIDALKLAFNTNKKGYCALGSVKTNIGHMNIAAGVAGFIKTSLALKHRLIPPNLHFETPNSKLDLENSPFYVNRNLKKWENDQYPLRAGVSSFGIGGTNAHIVLEEAPLRDNTLDNRKWKLVLLSARSGSALRRVEENLLKYLKKNPGINFADLAYTLQVGRKSFECRKMFICPDANAVTDLLENPDPKEVYTLISEEVNKPVVFMFPGQGSQYFNMGLELYKENITFRNEMDYCFDILKPIIGDDIKHILYPTGSGEAERDRINQTWVTQPLMFIFEYSLSRLLMRLGLKPHAMIGHSIGEYVAACLSGVFSLKDALTFVALRGKLMQSLPRGSMLSIPLSEEEITPLLNEDLSLAAVNGPKSCVISGPDNAIKRFAQKLQENGYKSKFLHTSHAFHSMMVNSISGRFGDEVSKVRFNKPEIPYISNVTGKWITVEEATDPAYWVTHLKRTVRFANGIKELLREEKSIFIEVGPGRSLSTFIKQFPGKKPEQKIINLIRHPRENLSDYYYLLNKLGQLWLYGKEIDWKVLYSGDKRNRIPIPTYPFERYHFPVNGSANKCVTGVLSEKSLLIKKKNIDEWFFLPLWKQTGLMTEEYSNESKPLTWLVFVDEFGLGYQLLSRIVQKGQVCTIVKPGVEFKKESDCCYRINPQDEKDYVKLFMKLHEMNLFPGRIVHLWSVYGKKDNELSFKRFKQAQEIGFYNLIFLAKAVSKMDITGEIQIGIVTNNMYRVTDEGLFFPEKSTLLGAVKSISQEYPGIKCCCIDIELFRSKDEHFENQVDYLFLEITKTFSDSVIVYRHKQRWIKIFESVRIEEQKEFPSRLRRNGVYLLIGGISDSGFVLAEYLLGSVNAKLILVDPADIPQRKDWAGWLAVHPDEDYVSMKIRKLKELENLAADIMIFNVDPADQKEMQRVLTHAEERLGRINGVIYALGESSEDRYLSIEQISKHLCEEQFRLKVGGVFVLEKFFHKRELDFCLLFSSISSVLVGPYSAAYSAANLFLDAFVQAQPVAANKLAGCSRHPLRFTQKCAHFGEPLRGRPTHMPERRGKVGFFNRLLRSINKKDNRSNPGKWISVIWDGLETKGVERLKASVTTSRDGWSMTKEDCIKVFRRIISCSKLNQIVVSTSDLQTRLQQQIEYESKQEANHSGAEDLKTFYSRPDSTIPYEPPRSKIERILTEIWQELLGIEKVGIHDSFIELGGDSLKMMTVASQIHRELNVKVPFEEFFNKSTIAELSDFIECAVEEKYESIKTVEWKEYYPLSSAQKRLYLLQQLDIENTSYNTTEIVMVQGVIDLDNLRKAFLEMAKRHESLRTSIREIDGNPVQRIQKEVDFEIEYCDLASKGKEVKNKRCKSNEPIKMLASDLKEPVRVNDNEKYKIDRIIRDFRRPFDLSKAPLMRAKLVVIGMEKQVLMVDMHHLISDGMSAAIFIKEFTFLYRGESLPALRMQYKDFSEWQNNVRQKERIEEQEVFWLKEFEGKVPVLDLPIDYNRPRIKNFEGRKIFFDFSREDTESLKEIASEAGATLYMLVLALYFVLLYKLSYQEDIIVGTPIEGRNHGDLRPIIGMFVNTLALRNYPSGIKTFREFLYEVKERALKAFENQDFQFEELVEKVGKHVDPGRNPLFDVLFQLNTIDSSVTYIPGLKILPYDFDNKTSKFDLYLLGIEKEGKLTFMIEYCSKLFKAGTIELFIENLKEITAAVLEDRSLDIILKDIKISGHEILAAHSGVPQITFKF